MVQGDLADKAALSLDRGSARLPLFRVPVMRGDMADSFDAYMDKALQGLVDIVGANAAPECHT